MADLSDPVPLPPGWDCKYDPRSARYYFVNHYTKITTWEDPRYRHRQLPGQSTPHHGQSTTECIPLQHGSPDLRRNYVYPSNSSPLRAFQMPDTYSPKAILRQDLNTGWKSSPLVTRAVQQFQTKQQETALMTSAADTEQLVAKIGAMFPTVTDTHIRLLLKKYYNREAVVMSALQVEKHPITTPGPYTTPPPPIKHFSPQIGRGGSPIPRPGSAGSAASFVGSPRFGEIFRSSPRPHSSPKMKLRYMKSIFPAVEETILLDVLGNNDNNVQKASETLIAMGFEKCEMKPPKLSAKKQREADAEKAAEEAAAKAVQQSLQRMRSVEEKNEMKVQLQEKYKNIPEPVICMALESVDYDKSRAIQILQIMVQEENEPKTSKESTPGKSAGQKEDEVESRSRTPKQETKTPEQSPVKTAIKETEKETNKAWRTKGKKQTQQHQEEVVESKENGYKSSYLTKTTGPNKEFIKGPNDEILLPDYIPWNGANPLLTIGSRQGLAKGPNMALIQSRTYQAKGANSELRKGPVFGLAKGSLYSQLNTVPVDARCHS